MQMQLSANVVYYTKSRVYFSQKTIYELLPMIYARIGKNLAQKCYTNAVFTSM